MADGSLKFDTKIDTGSFQKGLNNLSKTAQTGLQGVGVMLGTLGATAVAGVIAGAREYVDGAIDVASDLKEVQNVVDVTFKESSGVVNQWAKDAKNAYGMSELKAKQYTSTMGAMFKSMQLPIDQVLSMSMGVAGLTGDMASFYNLKHEDAFEKIKSGIAGETEGLKSLGINMSVANLEAYALSKGITKSFNSMNQGEQATLRYNYLMQVTADAQGDFARTSDGYANQQRILATTQEELAATIGEVFLPIALEATKALNSLVGGLGDAVEWVDNLLNPPKSELDNQISDAQKAVNDFNASINKAGQNLDTSLASAKATQATAMSLLKNYEAIQSKKALTAQDTAQLKSLAQQIVALYPDMGAAIDATTGLFNTNTGAIRDNVSALANQQQAMAYYAGTQEYQAALVNAAVVQQEAQNAYAAAWSDWQSKNTFAESLFAMREALRAGEYNADVLEQYAGSLISLSPSFAEFFEIAEDGTYKLTKLAAASTMTGSSIARNLNTQVEYYAGVAYTANEHTVTLGKSLTTANEAFDTANDQFEIASEKAQTLGETLLQTSDGVERLTAATGSLPGGLTRVSNGLRAESAETQKLREALKSLSEETLKQIDAQVNGFERIKKVRPKSAKTTVKDLNSQKQFLEDFSANLAKAKENGVSAEVLASLSDANAENAAVLAGLATAKASQVAEVNALYASITAEKTELANTIAEEQATLDAANKTLADTAATTDTTVVATANTTATGIKDAADTGKANASGLAQTATDAKTAEDAIATSTAAAKTAVKDMVENITSVIDENADTIQDAGGQIMDMVADAMGDNRSMRTVLQSKTVEAANGAKTSSYSSYYKVGQYLAQGVASGIRSGDWISRAMVDAINAALAAAKRAAGIRSPSRLFHDEVGAYLAQGVGGGFTDEMKNVNVLIAKSVAESVPTLDVSRQRSQWQTLAANESADSQQAQAVVNAQQYITFESTMQAPDEIARAIRKNNTHGLAAARRPRA